MPRQMFDHKQILAWLLMGLVVVFMGCSATEQLDSPKFGIVIHGGAGTILQKNMTAEREQAYRQKLTEALTAGYAVLDTGGTSVDAVEAAILVMENSELFNAGKGAVFAHDSTNQLDAAIMDGKTLNAGAVAGVRHIKNPIRLARLVMDNSRHVLLADAGAEQFARSQGMELIDQNYFFTQRRWNALQRALEKGAELTETEKHGTVGAAALDKHGNLAAGTSTGGLTNKQFNRIGDSPIIGAGTYANNATCAVSCTGHGEYFMRLLVAHNISAKMQYGGMSLHEAAETEIMKDLVDLGGGGGVIAIDRNGNIATPFNTPGMYRGQMSASNEPVVRIYSEEQQD